jgi:hypothetical protein
LGEDEKLTLSEETREYCMGARGFGPTHTAMPVCHIIYVFIGRL